jgi:hypothetical protein
MEAGLNEDTLGGILKCGLAQYVALEITRGNNRENRAVARYLPWLYTAPTIQQGYVSSFVSVICFLFAFNEYFESNPLFINNITYHNFSITLLYIVYIYMLII